MVWRRFARWTACALTVASPFAHSQDRTPAAAPGELHLRIASQQPGKHRSVTSVVWLQALPGTPVPPFAAQGEYTLLQKNRMFTPHLQVVPVGSVIRFPNADPFFHNVFSLFDGKRFDLGLYEAGSSKAVTFSREGVSYIFCNIHPEMSAVVLSLSTPLYAVADADGSFVLRKIPPGDYRMQLWVEGAPQQTLELLSRNLHIQSRTLDLGTITVPIGKSDNQHANKFGNPYDQAPKSYGQTPGPP